MDPTPHAGLKGREPRAKAREFCQAVLDGRQFREANEKIDRFLGDAEAKGTYVAYTKRRAEIQERQERGFQLTAGEITELEKMQRELSSNEVIRDFVEASDELERIKVGAVAFIEKAFELCRPPSEEDIAAEGKLLEREAKQRTKEAKQR